MAEKATSGGISIDAIANGFKQYIRILQMTRKPTNEEFMTISKVARATSQEHICAGLRPSSSVPGQALKSIDCPGGETHFKR